MNYIDVMKQALEALPYGFDAARCDYAFKLIQKAEQALRAAIAQAEKREPVGYVYSDAGNQQSKCAVIKRDVPNGTPLYTNPAPSIWLRAIDEALTSSHLGIADASDSYEDAKKKLNDLIDWNIQVATDPTVNGEWKLVPVIPTGEMISAMRVQTEASSEDNWHAYAAMLAAAPEYKP